MDKEIYSGLKDFDTLNISIYCEYFDMLRFGSVAAKKKRLKG